VEPPGRAQLERRIMAGEWREFTRIDGFVEREEDDRKVALIAIFVEQGFERVDEFARQRDIRTLIAPEAR